ncbi:hypothetical protein [Bradyrhizobium sp. Arg816]|uniref:hypothetical protein n=1 Tax=Bradyrhizobium sp. Arg816 TaxID=2998491 RepID=UPI00249F6E2F|nr:hypothetical protein [Bradyrhizobium sp. Arg816]MDI3560636.1 hypothetical protein [Bradyrhizobium sp. Arg816]
MFYVFEPVGIDVRRDVEVYDEKFIPSGGPSAVRLYDLMDKIGAAGSVAELADAERDTNGTLKFDLEKHSRGDADAAERAVLALATRRLECLTGRPEPPC